MCGKRLKANPEPDPDGWDEGEYEEFKKAAEVEKLRKKARDLAHFLSLLHIGGFAMQVAKARADADSKLAGMLLGRIDEAYELREMWLDYLSSRAFDMRVVKEHLEQVLEYMDRLRQSRGQADDFNFSLSREATEPICLAHLLTMPPKEFGTFFERLAENYIKPRLEEVKRRGGRQREWEQLYKLIREKEGSSDKVIASMYSRRFSRKPKEHRDKVTADKVREVRQNYKRREQNHD